MRPQIFSLIISLLNGFPFLLALINSVKNCSEAAFRFNLSFTLMLVLVNLWLLLLVAFDLFILHKKAYVKKSYRVLGVLLNTILMVIVFISFMMNFDKVFSGYYFAKFIYLFTPVFLFSLTIQYLLHLKFFIHRGNTLDE